jgi:hypothetical protein
MFLRWHMHSIVRDFKAAGSKFGKTKGNPWKSLTQQALCAIKNQALIRHSSASSSQGSHAVYS